MIPTLPTVDSILTLMIVRPINSLMIFFYLIFMFELDPSKEFLRNIEEAEIAIK